MMRKLFYASCLGLLALSGHAQKPSPEIIFQVATLDSLMTGNYDGTTTFGRLKNLGDFGLGTFNQLNGEMIGLDGQFYQVKADGQAYPVKRSMKTPFADVTFFDADQRATLNQPLNFEQLSSYLDSLLPDKNAYYAIKIEGRFRYLKTRSEHEQQKPYPPLAEVLANQIIFEYEQMEGTMVGFWMPEAAQGISTTGYHFHFISADKNRGGHVLDCEIGAVRIAVDNSDGLKVIAPGK